MTVNLNLNGWKSYLGFALLFVAGVGEHWWPGLDPAGWVHVTEFGQLLAGVGIAHKIAKLHPAKAEAPEPSEPEGG